MLEAPVPIVAIVRTVPANATYGAGGYERPHAAVQAPRPLPRLLARAAAQA